VRREQRLLQYEAAFENVQGLVFVLDADGRFDLVTPEFADRLGYGRPTLRGRAADAVFGDRLTVGAAGPGSIETTAETATGESVPVRIDLVSLPDGEDVGGHVGSVTDISELAATRERLADERERFVSLFEYLPDPVLEVEFGGEALRGSSNRTEPDYDGPVVRSINSAFAETFGTSEAELVGEPAIESLVPTDDRETVQRLHEQLTEAGAGTVEVRRRTVDGYRYFVLRAVAFDAEEGLSRAFAIFTDITDQRRRENQLQILTRVLRHNVRNDMSVVLNYADQIADDTDDESIRSMAEAIHDRADHIVAVSRRAQSLEGSIARAVTDGTVVDLRAVVEEAVEEVTEAHPAATVSVGGSESIPVGGGERMHAVVVELLSNSIQHNDAANPSVDVSIRRDGTDAVVEIADDGPGIPEEDRAVVTGEREITQLSHASGLGLWSVRFFLDVYGGDLDFETTDAGTTVTVRVPLAD
jgi:PAS domain S-box-containing protein